MPSRIAHTGDRKRPAILTMPKPSAQILNLPNAHCTPSTKPHQIPWHRLGRHLPLHPRIAPRIHMSSHRHTHATVAPCCPTSATLSNHTCISSHEQSCPAHTKTSSSFVRTTFPKHPTSARRSHDARITRSAGIPARIVAWYQAWLAATPSAPPSAPPPSTPDPRRQQDVLLFARRTRPMAREPTVAADRGACLKPVPGALPLTSLTSLSVLQAPFN
ncbi:hypothetical protein EJ04DRAFT_157217 [Polyplosphaeria fusca]|uniref:Uncharacterized protein n=1 Tax=Polyplosphaeria fusca TaxID=682080 RepID=A0A9P4V3C6_9PLEO|nr:hypothetical protein EJ04DRAFT_157217 [Polyplosphaeria fusca]